MADEDNTPSDSREAQAGILAAAFKAREEQQAGNPTGASAALERALQAKFNPDNKDGNDG